jgi:TonB-linked SusC/RagA family outer membrane protein
MKKIAHLLRANDCCWKKMIRAMKISLFLVLVSLQVCAKNYGQQTLSLSTRNSPLIQVIKAIEKQSSYRFYYSDDVVPAGKQVTIVVKNATLEEVMNKMLADLPLSWKLVDENKIVISTGDDDNAPERRVITGRVTAADGQPLPGASVTIKGSATGVTTDAQGMYKITVGETDKVLVISFTGYTTVEKPLGTEKVINISLTALSKSLDDVIVIGYGTQKKGDLTGSVGSIKAEELQKTKSTSFIEAMQGRVAGVQITSASGEPGAAVNINIRGANSINAGTAPLYVIDGVQIDANSNEVAGFSTVSNPLSSINPSDIESIEILKDASATAIFGSRGANGVIIITTKGGKENAALELDTYWGIASPSKKLSLLNGQEYANYRFLIEPTSATYGQDTNGDGIYDKPKDFSNVPWHDWQKEVLRPALLQNYNVFYSGGNAKTKFATSLGYFRQEGIVKKNRYERYSANLKIDHTASDKFKIGTSVNASYVLGSGVASSGAQTITYNGVVQTLVMYKPVNVAEDGLSTLDPDNLGLSNPLDFVNYSYKQSPLTRLVGNVYGEYSFSKALALRVSGGGVLTSSEDGEFYPSTTSWGYSRNGLAVLNTSNTVNWFNTNTLTYTKRFKNHYLNAMVGFETNSYMIKTFAMRGEGFDIQTTNGVDNIHQAKVLTQVPTTNKSLSTRESEFGRINYNYKSKYLFTATLRRDGSSKFGANNKYAWFPSGALAWNATKEPFMKSASVINNLKIRTSFGITGNDRIPAYQALAVGSSTYYSAVQTAELGIAITSIANPALKWETTYQYDAGMDLELWKGRVALTADVYKKETKDMLLYADVAGQTGFYKQWRNIGRVDNTGLELAINTSNITTKNFSWNTAFNITFNRNKVRSLGGVGFLPIRISDQITDVGRVIVDQPIGTGYGYVFDGIYQLSDFENPSSGTYVLKPGVVKRSGISVKPGDFKFKDLTDDGAVDNVNDMQVISNSNPKHYGGFNNNFTYKNFDLSVFFVWSYGNDIMNIGRYRTEGWQGSNLSTDFWQNRWSATNPSNTHPGLVANGRFDASSYYVEDGSYLRLKNVSFGYNLPAATARKLGLKSIRAYITGENLVTWTSYTGFDPEIASTYNLLPGLESISYPRSRTFTLGLNVKF